MKIMRFVLYIHEQTDRPMVCFGISYPSHYEERRIDIRDIDYRDYLYWRDRLLERSQEAADEFSNWYWGNREIISWKEYNDYFEYFKYKEYRF